MGGSDLPAREAITHEVPVPSLLSAQGHCIGQQPGNGGECRALQGTPRQRCVRALQTLHWKLVLVVLLLRMHDAAL